MEICHVTQFFQQLERMNNILSEGESACSKSRQQQNTGTNASREQFGEKGGLRYSTSLQKYNYRNKTPEFVEQNDTIFGSMMDIHI